jgi:general secretion pathway protein F
MALYRYEAVTPAGQVLQGEMEGEDQAAVVSWLQEAGNIPVRAEPARAKSFISRFSRALPGSRTIGKRDLALLTRELSVLLHAGLPLDRALQIIVNLNAGSPIGSLAGSIQDAVRGGAALSAALEAHKGTFTRFFVSMVRAAEASGTLDAQLRQLADYQERSKALRDTVVSALVYPCILIVVASVSLLIILAYVVPQFSQLFADAGQALPLATQLVIGVADWLRSYGWLLAIIVVAAGFLLRLQLANDSVRYRWDSLQLRLPLIGTLVKRIEMARFSRGLGTLLASGVSLLTSMSIVKEILTNRALSESLNVAVDALKDGRGMADALIAAGMFPALGLQMLKVGEESGHLDEMLLRAADIYDREVSVATQRLLTLLEPILIVGLGVVIAGVIMSLMLAIVSINNLPL